MQLHNLRSSLRGVGGDTNDKYHSHSGSLRKSKVARSTRFGATCCTCRRFDDWWRRFQLAAGVRFGCVLADAGYGLNALFRQGLTARGLTWAVGILRRQKVYPETVKLNFSAAGRGRPRRRHRHVSIAKKWEPVPLGKDYQTRSRYEC